jgi:UDP-N-acetylglucosamine--N-acetylmuramyl-(pentapeptide) pyrophosphoryl-undecaprenol N-acetylglucosamine transferase
MRIIVAGGGTGGHITPNIAVLEELQTKINNPEILYVGSKGGLEATLIPAKGWKFRAISCGKLRRYFSWENFLDVFRTSLGVLQSLAIIAGFKPQVIFCKGGFVSLPVAVAGGLLGKEVIIHESDLEMGLANKLAARFARVICVSFPETAQQMKGNKKVVLTGNPVRRELAEGSAEKAYEFTGLKPGRQTILVMGGSQGSQFLNGIIFHHLHNLLKEYQLVHVCGKGNLPEHSKYSSKDGYFALEYLGKEQKDVLAITDLFIGRAGANSLAELDFLGLPAILIPLVAGSRGDQIRNAESFAKNHNCLVLDETKVNPEKLDLLKEIDMILDKTKRHKTVKPPAAAGKIADIIISLAEKHVKKN